jgi:hypothetical protein
VPDRSTRARRDHARPSSNGYEDHIIPRRACHRTAAGYFVVRSAYQQREISNADLGLKRFDRKG